MSDDRPTWAPPTLTDALGRIWEWVPGGSGDLYRHDSMAWSRSMVERDDVRYPPAAILDNPNYVWCDSCAAAITANT